MRTQAAARLLEQLSNDPDLRAEFTVENKTRDERIAAAVALGKQKGFKLTAAECVTFVETAARTRDGELADRLRSL